VALAYTLSKPGVTSLVIGARTNSQLADNLAAVDVTLVAEELARLDEIRRPPLSTPTGTRPPPRRIGSPPADLSLLAHYIDHA